MTSRNVLWILSPRWGSRALFFGPGMAGFAMRDLASQASGR